MTLHLGDNTMTHSVELFKTNPYKAVSYSESAITKAAEKAGSLIADVKYDGVRGNVVVQAGGNASWLSRVSKPIPALDYMNGFDLRWSKVLNDDRWIYPKGFMLDGELMVKGVDFNTGSGLLRTVHLKDKNKGFDTRALLEWDKKLWGTKTPFRLASNKLEVRLYAILPLDIIQAGDDVPVMNSVMQIHVQQMIMVLRDHFPEIDWQLAETYDVFDMDSLKALYEEVRERGLEGLVVKDPYGYYKRGKKSGWWKMKPENEADGVVQGLVWGTEGLANAGKVIGFEVLLESGRVVNATNISKALMDEFTAKWLEANTEEFTGTIAPNPVNPYEGWQCQISYMEETPDGSLRHPSFVMFRGTEDNPQEKI
ncbi:DNA ligase [Pectobacterium phage PP47]|uniref:DNA ligase n=2 Tax=Pektosvirus TaxID=2732689 RepID=A0A1L7DS10_9CAUD|nr:DNA ligase [Pectobacterium phage PP81]YP_009788708.1 DNA ligase [Pectobacterium phage PP47]APU03069.1 DNA ligase [Pectobacterium phage PP81]APW79752.1 DNA ligase [Pectobacterium phage PP47]